MFKPNISLWCKILLAAVLCLGSAQGQMALTGAGGTKPKAVVASYTGPGDVKTGWTAYWAYRAFSAATRGNKLVNLCNSTGGVDVLCADAFSDPTTGTLVIPSSLTSFCPGSVCTVATRYDISGASNCGAPCDFSVGSITSREILTANAISTKTCGTGTGHENGNGSFVGLAQPFTVTAVAKFATTGTNQFYFGASGGGGNGFGALTAFGFYASNNVTGAATDTNPHAFQNVANSAASFVVVDTSTSSTQSSGGTALGSLITMDADQFGNAMSTGSPICEVGVYPAAFSGTDATNMYNNQHTYWGF